MELVSVELSSSELVVSSSDGYTSLTKAIELLPTLLRLEDRGSPTGTLAATATSSAALAALSSSAAAPCSSSVVLLVSSLLSPSVSSSWLVLDEAAVVAGGLISETPSTAPPVEALSSNAQGPSFFKVTPCPAPSFFMCTLVNVLT